MRTELPISQFLGVPDPNQSGVITRDPQGALAINEHLMQTIFDDRWLFRVRVVSGSRDRSYFTTLTVVRKPHSPVFGLRQCCYTSPDRPGKFECFRTSPQEDNDLHGRDPERTLTINEQDPYDVRSKVPVVP